LKYFPAALFLGAVSVSGMGGCAAAKQAQDLASGCDELNGGDSAIAGLSIDAKFKAFVQATADLQAVAVRVKGDVKAACADLATKLGGTDSWTALGDSDDAISNSMKTGACDVASAKIDATLKANAMVTATLTVSGGQCSVNADVQAQCEGSCKADVSCMEPEITARCDPGQLSGQCSGTCNAMATCEGSATVQADCQGSCEATCTGTCTGACTGTVTGGCMGMCDGKCDGMATPAGGMANCMGTCEGKCTQPAATAMCSGKCEASCKGKCSGNCKLDADAMVMCGANVSCKGGCSVMYTAPKCEAELKPPMCMGDANCQASCSGRASLKAECTPPTVVFTFTGDGDATALATLKAAIEADLPKIVLVAKTEGKLLGDAAAKVAATGSASLQAVGSLGGKALACIQASAAASVKASASVSVSVQASASVSGSASGGTT
jgi:hypothetical protein